MSGRGAPGGRTWHSSLAARLDRITARPLAVLGRIARWFRQHLLGTFAVLGMIAFTCGLIGMYRQFRSEPNLFSWPNIIFFTATLFLADGTVFENGGQFPITLEIARFLAPLATAVGVADAASTVFAQRFERFRARHARHHVVVCGTGPTASALVDKLSRSKRVILVAEDAEREYPDAERPPRLLRVVGDPVEPLVLAGAGISRADVVYGCLPDTSSNLAIALAARRLAVGREDNPLRCLAQVGDLSLIPHLRARRIGLDDDTGFRLDFFAVEVLGAHALLSRYPPSWAAGGPGAVPPQGPAPLVVLGLSGLGQALVMELARRWRGLAGDDGPRLHITVSDPRAQERLANLRSREPALARTDVTPHVSQHGDLPPPVTDPGSMVRPPEFVYVCHGDEEAALLLGLDAAQALNTGRAGVARTTVIVRTGRQRSLQEVFGRRDTADGARTVPGPLLEDVEGGVRFFAVNDEALPLDLGDTDLIERFAKAVHERYLADEIGRGVGMGARRSMAPWDELPEDLRDSNRAQAAQFGEVLRAQAWMLMPAGEADTDFAFSATEIEDLAEREHERWREERTRRGFSLGPEDGAELRHPAMVDWDDLSETDRERDREAVRGIPAVLAHAGLRIVRLNDPG